MRVMKRRDHPDSHSSEALLGYDGSDACLLLVHQWEVSGYDTGSGFGHIAIETDDLQEICDSIKANGGHILREPGPDKHISGVMAFAEDPDGYMIALFAAS